MKELCTHGWRFCFDKELTDGYYREQDWKCSCACCRNFYDNVDGMPSELQVFLQQFGVDIAKPVEQWSVMADKEQRLVENVLYYAVHGTAQSDEKHEIDIGSFRITIDAPKPGDAVQSPECSPNTTMPEPYFIITVYNLWLPWTVPDDIDDCYPEKKSLWKWLKTKWNKRK